MYNWYWSGGLYCLHGWPQLELPPLTSDSAVETFPKSSAVSEIPHSVSTFRVVGFTEPIFSVTLFPFFQNNENTGHLYDITSIFDRRHRSWVSETPNKYERALTHWGRVTYIFASLIWPSLVQIMACRLDGAKPLSEPMLEYCQLDP